MTYPSLSYPAMVPWEATPRHWRQLLDRDPSPRCRAGASGAGRAGGAGAVLWQGELVMVTGGFQVPKGNP